MAMYGVVCGRRGERECRSASPKKTPLRLSYVIELEKGRVEAVYQVHGNYEYKKEHAAER